MDLAHDKFSILEEQKVSPGHAQTRSRKVGSEVALTNNAKLMFLKALPRIGSCHNQGHNMLLCLPNSSDVCCCLDLWGGGEGVDLQTFVSTR